jgi:hypothetical protein
MLQKSVAKGIKLRSLRESFMIMNTLQVKVHRSFEMLKRMTRYVLNGLNSKVSIKDAVGAPVYNKRPIKYLRVENKAPSVLDLGISLKFQPL